MSCASWITSLCALGASQRLRAKWQRVLLMIAGHLWTYTSRNPKGEAPPSGQTLGTSPCAFGGTVLYQLALSQLCVVSALQYSAVQYSMFCCHMFPSHAPATVLYALYTADGTVQYTTAQDNHDFVLANNTLQPSEGPCKA